MIDQHPMLLAGRLLASLFLCLNRWHIVVRSATRASLAHLTIGDRWHRYSRCLRRDLESCRQDGGLPLINRRRCHVIRIDHLLLRNTT